MECPGFIGFSGVYLYYDALRNSDDRRERERGGREETRQGEELTGKGEWEGEKLGVFPAVVMTLPVAGAELSCKSHASCSHQLETLGRGGPRGQPTAWLLA